MVVGRSNDMWALWPNLWGEGHGAAGTATWDQGLDADAQGRADGVWRESSSTAEHVRGKSRTRAVCHIVHSFAGDDTMTLSRARAGVGRGNHAGAEGAEGGEGGKGRRQATVNILLMGECIEGTRIVEDLETAAGQGGAKRAL